MDKLRAGVDEAVRNLAATHEAGIDAATAVMTTDTVPKHAESTQDGWAVGGFAKGAGMCAPNMATMLAVLTTDAVPVDAQEALREAVDATFNRLDVDGGTSTNDTVLLLCSGASGRTPPNFTAVLTAVCQDLVNQLQADAEGVTKHVTVTVRGARTAEEARLAAKQIANDNLCKTAFFGSDPNWGRVAMAVGNAPTEFDPAELDITINGVPVCRAGTAAEDRTKADLSGRDVEVEVHLHAGEGEATVLTTDLSHGYVEENSADST
jgi:glutamate N-acetyltransferase / amino-acid N-acetyltransferase